MSRKRKAKNSRNILACLRERGEVVRLGKKGEWKTICPFHREKTPSFRVNAISEKWYCFGCGHGGQGTANLEALLAESPAARD